MKQVYGLTLRHHARAWRDYPEIQKTSHDMAIRQVLAKIADNNAHVITEPELVKTIPYRRVKERHHQHGWQMVEQECSLGEAEMVLCVYEATVEE